MDYRSRAHKRAAGDWKRRTNAELAATGDARVTRPDSEKGLPRMSVEEYRLIVRARARIRRLIKAAMVKKLLEQDRAEEAQNPQEVES